ncbi:MAG: ribonuclease P protein component [Candidatus Ancillula trichonymphae]|jgi:ribonuclease P protein component|nr:ribonuclease P protein component [Candidatus Ancillula trichonymphae]
MQEIRKANEYNAVFKKRRVCDSSSFLVHYAKDTVFRCGIVVSKAVGNSVVRHKKYRQFREIVRSFPCDSYRFAAVIRVKRAAVYKTFWELLNELVLVFDKIKKELCL